MVLLRKLSGLFGDDTEASSFNSLRYAYGGFNKVSLLSLLVFV